MVDNMEEFESLLGQMGNKFVDLRRHKSGQWLCSAWNEKKTFGRSWMEAMSKMAKQIQSHRKDKDTFGYATNAEKDFKIGTQSELSTGR